MKYLALIFLLLLGLLGKFIDVSVVEQKYQVVGHLR
jgi:hypothetical protein